MPANFGIWVEERTLSVLLRRQSIRVRGGEVGDIRSLEAPMSEEDREFLTELYCEIEQTKPQFNEVVTAEESGTRVRLARGGRLRAEDGSVWFETVSPALNEPARRVLNMYRDRLPLARMPPLDAYVSPVDNDCAAPSDFQLTEGFFDGTPRFTVKADGSFAFLRAGTRGTLPTGDVDRVACALSRYDFTVLWTNPEGRKVICPERVAYQNTPNIGWHYTGMTLDVTLHGTTVQLRVGNCPSPLDIHRTVSEVRIEAAHHVASQ